MAAARDTTSVITQELLRMLGPLQRAFSSTDGSRALLHRLGWDVDALPAEWQELGARIIAAHSSAEQILAEPASAEAWTALIGACADCYDALLGSTSLPSGIPAGEIGPDELARELLELLMVDYLRTWRPQLYALFRSLHVITSAHTTPIGGRRGLIRHHFHWDRLPSILQDPHRIVQAVYSWGTPALATDRLVHELANFLHGLGFTITVFRVPDELGSNYADQPRWLREGATQGLKLPFHYGQLGEEPYELSLLFVPLGSDTDALPGLILQPQFPTDFPASLQIGANTSLQFTFTSDLEDQFGLLLRPDGVTFKYPFKDDDSTPSITLGIAVASNPPDAVSLLGDPLATRIQYKGFTIGLKATGPVNDIEVVFSADLHELSVVLAAGEGDGFLRSLLGDGETKIDVPLGIDWSSKHGLGFRGSLNFEVQLHPHLELGPLKIPDLRLSLTITPDDPAKARIEGVITLSGQLGPLAVVIEGIGVQALFDFVPGNLGPMDLLLGFRPPDGVGLSIDAGAFRGGGFLRYDAEREEYAGMLQLSVMDMFTITAIGMITTRMPDGSEGFSFLAIISAEFNPGIQLGFGFTLLGVGGIVGLNRGLALEALSAAVHSGTASNFLFPTGDIIAQAPRIISDLRTIFPPEEGTFLIGPMAKIGWGTPTLVSITMGVIIEIPGDLAIVGVLRVALPTVEAPLILIQAAFIGAFQPDRQRLWFYSKLFESRLLAIPLEGSIGLLMAWGDDANFVLSVGGFHPRFDPPALPFPALERISCAILDSEHARIRVESYHAVTSNTVQFGANAELYFGYDDFCVEGHLGFDALFQFSPFYFIIEVRAGLTLKIFGFDTCNIKLQFTLEGPTPWHAHGTGSIGFLFWDFDVDFDEVWGDGADTALPPVQMLPLFRAESEKRENWKAALPPASNLLVSIRDVSDDTGDLIMHPLGSLRFSQRLVPIGLTIDKLGNQKPDDVNRFDIDPSDASGLTGRGGGNERFAMAQFLDMGEEEKLSLPAFESVPGGIDLGVADALSTSRAACRTIRYEETWLDSEYKKHQDFGAGFDRGLFGHFIVGAAIASSSLSTARKNKMDPFPDKVRVSGDMGYAVADMDTNAVHAAGGIFGSQAIAKEMMKRAIAMEPELAARLVVLPENELMN